MLKAGFARFSIKIALGLPVHQGLQVIHLVTLGEPHLYPHVPERDGEHRERPPVKERRSHYVLPHPRHIQDTQQHGRLPGSRGGGGDTVLQRGHPLLEHLGSGVRYACIDISRLAEGEKVHPVLHVVKHVCSALVDRHSGAF